MSRKILANRKNTAILLLIILLFTFLFSSSIWHIWQVRKYEPFSEGMKYAATSSGIVPRYTLKVSGDTYYVKYPDFFSTTGNLAIKPSDDSVLDSLLIWPQLDGTFRYGVILNHSGISYQVYIDRSGDTALYEEYQWLVDTHQEIIRQYLAKANAMWDLSE